MFKNLLKLIKILIAVILVINFNKFEGKAVAINFDLEKSNKLQLKDNIYSNSLDDEYMVASICIGNPNQCFRVLLDTGSDKLWIANKDCDNCDLEINKFDRGKSNTFSLVSNDSININYISGTVTGYIASDSIFIDNFEIKNFFFILADNIKFSNKFDGVLGLGFRYLNNKYSLIDSLYINKIINRRAFTQLFDTTINRDKGAFYLGEYDLPYTYPNNYTECSVTKQSIYWQCNFNSIYFDGDIVNRFNINRLVIIDTGSNTSIVPKNILDPFIKKYFKQYIDKAICNYSKDKSNIWGLSCNKNFSQYLSNLPTINYVLENRSVLNIHNYFNKDDRFGLYFLQLIAFDRKDMFLIGQPFLKNYIVQFDKDDKMIRFAGDVKTADFIFISNFGKLFVIIVNMTICYLLYDKILKQEYLNYLNKLSRHDIDNYNCKSIEMNKNFININ